MRLLNSMTLGPLAVSIRPQKRQPLNGWPSSRMPRRVGSTTPLRISSITFGVTVTGA